MSQSTKLAIRIALGAMLACLTISDSTATAPPSWDFKKTQKYLDDRVTSWFNWPTAARGQNTSCISCHTVIPYALSRSAVTKLSPGVGMSDAEKRLLTSVRKRVKKWDELVSIEPEGNDPLATFYGGAKRNAALDTESVLNALVLVNSDMRAGLALSETASKALDHMWGRQGANGVWQWLNFGLRPWEKDGEYYGAALAAVAAGSAGDRYAPATTEAGKKKTTALRKYLKSKAPEQAFHYQALGLWANSFLKDVFTDGERKQIVSNLFALQRQDGGWSLLDLGKKKITEDAPGWEAFTRHPDGAVSDGYGTGLVVLALKRSGVSAEDERLKKGVAWLMTHQAADGTWPAVYINRERNPANNIGKFMRDAGAAFAVLALTEAP